MGLKSVPAHKTPQVRQAHSRRDMRHAKLMFKANVFANSSSRKKLRLTPGYEAQRDEVLHNGFIVPVDEM